MAARTHWPATLRRAIRAEGRIEALRAAVEEFLWGATGGRCRICGVPRPAHGPSCEAAHLARVVGRDEVDTHLMDELARRSRKIRELESEAQKLEEKECPSCTGLGVLFRDPEGVAECPLCNGQGRIWRHGVPHRA
jgi:hypothetical protein